MHNFGAQVRASEAQHGKVMAIFEQWNNVLKSAKEKFACTCIMTPHMLLGMVDEAHTKIAALEERVGYLQSKHDEFSTKIASSVDQQTIAVRGPRFRRCLVSTGISVHDACPTPRH
jgi:hypothetical protein